MLLDAQAIDDLVRRALERARTLHPLPESTYRLQFHVGFTFKDAIAVIPYLAKLGITHVYASPYLKAKPKSTHGYDVIDHCKLNPELGSEADYEMFLARLREHGMAHICDMVPNHVGIGTNDNAWWNDVLEDGPASIYSRYFDINWVGSPQSDLQGRLLVPVLGAMFGEELESGKLELHFAGDSFYIKYHEHRFPLSPHTYPLILAACTAKLDTEPRGQKECRAIIRDCESLPDRCEGSAVAADRHKRKLEIKQRLKQLADRSDIARRIIHDAVGDLNGTSGKPGSFDRLEQLLRRQCFRLAYWRTAPDEINYRRFFDVNELAALSMERLEVFLATHTFILQLVAQGKISGLRIDHPDGLYDPKIYFQRLQTYYTLAVAKEMFLKEGAANEKEWNELRPLVLERIEQTSVDPSFRPLYVLGEKILAHGETLPQNWALAGTTGYEFLNMTNGLFIDSSHEKDFDRIYQGWTRNKKPFADMAYENKKLILKISLASELNMLTMELKRISQPDRRGIDYSFHSLLVALREVIACFPVYRTYISHEGPGKNDVDYLHQAIECAIKRNSKIEPTIFRYIQSVLIGDSSSGLSREELTARRHFAAKFQQVSAPVMAKGIEDTAFYIYNRLLSLNEVGGDPSRFGVSPSELHQFFEARQRDWPLAMSTLSTHDTKRSEDVRARLDVLSEIPEEWSKHIERWGAMNEAHKTVIDGNPAPDRNEEYALYQTLLGAWPEDSANMESFIERTKAYMMKAGREAKTYSSWNSPNLQRENAVGRFIDVLLMGKSGEAFRHDFAIFQKRISRCGMFNSLSQTLIKLTAPGVPDTYQGNALFDFSLVDPDNRRPVSFSRRNSLINEVQKCIGTDEHIGEKILEYLNSPDPEPIKLLVHQAVLNCRRKNRGLFTTGYYQPLKVTGEFASKIFAFMRRDSHRIAIVAVPRLIADLFRPIVQWSQMSQIWKDTQIILFENQPPIIFRDAFSRSRIGPVKTGTMETLPVSRIFANLPFCLLLSE